MKYVLVTTQSIKLLINEGCDTQPLLEHMPEIETLAQTVTEFYRDLMNKTADEGIALDNEKRDLTAKIGYNIIGVPFTNHDAEMYALSNKLDYTELSLES